MALNLRKPYNHPPDSAARKYSDNTMIIDDQLKRIKAALKKHADEFKANPRNWGCVGDMTYVRQQLAEILEHLGE